MDTMKKRRSDLRRVCNRLANQLDVLIGAQNADVKEMETSCEKLQEKEEALKIVNQEIFEKLLRHCGYRGRACKGIGRL